jgi:hypothetical protein
LAVAFRVICDVVVSVLARFSVNFSFKDTSWIDVSVSRKAKSPKYNAVDADVEDATPHCLIRTSKTETEKIEKNAPNYSPTLHQST